MSVVFVTQMIGTVLIKFAMWAFGIFINFHFSIHKLILFGCICHEKNNQNSLFIQTSN